MTSYERLANLELRIERIVCGRLRAVVATRAFTRVTTTITLEGEKCTGVGEDVSFDRRDHCGEYPPGVLEGLTGRYALGEWLDALAGSSLCVRRDPGGASFASRRWAFESAALDLALRQASETLGGALGLRARPIRFVASTRLGEPPTIRPIEERLARQSDVRFKLDPTSAWDEDLFRAVAATRAVEVIDLKAHYSGSMVDQPPEAALYERCLRWFPDSIVEDPGVCAATRSLLAPHVQRIAWDASISDVAAIDRLPWPAAAINVKPARVGRLRSLLELYERCRDDGTQMYGGGLFELGRGRAQIQALASLFHPDGPNDVAPAAYNASPLPASLPPSPLIVTDEGPGFG